jgi:hypothetical protein
MNFPCFNRKKISLAIAIIVLLVLIAFFAFRGVVLRKVIESVAERFREHHYTTSFEGARFRGLRTVTIDCISIISDEDSNSVRIKSLYIKPRLFPLLARHLRIKKLRCDSIDIRYHIADRNVDEKLPDQRDSTGFFDGLKGRDLAGFAYKNIRRLFSYIPQQVNMGNMNLQVNYLGDTSHIALNDFRLNRGVISSILVLSGDSATMHIPVQGKMDKQTSEISLTMTSGDTALLPVPVLRDKYGFETGFDSLNFSMSLINRNRHLVSPEGVFTITGFELKGRRLSTGSVRVDRFSSSFGLHIGSNFIEVDSATVTRLNQIRLNPYFRLDIRENPVITFKIIPQTWAANDFFSSLPEGMFTSLTGIKTEGLLHFHLAFKVDMANPDSLYFNSKFTGENFRITGYGIDDYRMMNGSFMHRVYEKSRVVAAFMVGPENPDFVPFEEISPFVRAAVMTSEDGSFFYHNGFNPEAFREAIATNIKEGRFARGGSTITMQLVKNVFLTRNKTLARKIEEALIVWLIESKNLVPKQRMYEVYLNIIEWGPGIYGINQASHFYFDKRPPEVTLQEAVFLASIVPHPKWYRYTFVANGQPKPFYGNYMRRMKELMVRKQFINPVDTTGIAPFVTLTGRAADVFVVNDTAVVDSVSIEDMDILPVF